MKSEFGSRSTATQVVDGVDLTGKVAVVTGGNCGIGKETARVLAGAGARVIITCRTLDKGKAAAAEIKATGVKRSIEALAMELSDLTSVDAASAELHRIAPQIDMVILNAGVMAIKERETTKQGFEKQLGCNHFGHFAFLTPLLPHLKAQATPVRIVSLSSRLHSSQKTQLQFDDVHFGRRKYGNWDAYGQSKTANVLFVKQIAKDYRDSKIEAFAVHPGIILTNLTRHVAPARSMGALVTSALYKTMHLVLGDFKTIPEGAATSVYAAVSPDLDGQSGAYLVDCAPSSASKTASDPEQAAKLWEVTEAQLAAARSPAGFMP